MAANNAILSHIKALEFDLYLDESGDFVNPNKNWLIGGYLLPHTEDNSAMIEGWWRRILSAVDAKWPTRAAEYALAHCIDAKNSLYGAVPTAQVQPMVLEMLLRFIGEAGGFPVIFLSPKGICHPNGEMNYVALLSKGYAQLLQRMQQLHPGTIIRIYPHPSHRQEESGRWLMLRGTDEEIRQQYICFMLASAYGLCFIDDLMQSLNGMEIITAQKPPRVARSGDFEHRCSDEKPQFFNLYNVIADYISNSYYNLEQGNYAALLKDAMVFPVSRDGRPVSVQTAPAPVAEPIAAKAPARPEIPDCLAFLLSRTGIFDLNQMSAEEQREIISRLCGELEPLVMRQEDMDSTHRNLDKLLSLADGIESEAVRAELKANLLLFKIGILNHLGKIDQAEALSDRFSAALGGIADDSARNALNAQFFNRRIVLRTDQFDYEAAESVFRGMQAYWEDHLKAFGKSAGISSRAPSLSSVVCAEYGYTIGSVLQAARHRIRLSRGPERFGIYTDALDRARIARMHMDTNYDLSRLEQTMSNIESEMGYFDAAFDHLFNAVRLIGSDAWKEKHAAALSEDARGITEVRCSAIIGVVGQRDAKNRPEIQEPFILSHYLRLACEMSIAGDARFAIMRDALLKHKGALEPKSYDAIRSIHPRTQILWKLGSIIARSGMPKEGARLMNAAFKQLGDTGVSIFSAIAIAIGAERIALVPGSGDKPEELRRLYSSFVARKSLDMLDPFAACGVNGPLLGGEFTAEDMMKISRVIAY